MALPITRDLTFAPGTQIPSAVLNNIQDQIIGLYGGKHGDLTAFVPLNFNTRASASEWPSQITTGNMFFETVAAEIMGVALQLKVGDRLKSVTATVFDNGAGQINFGVYRQALTGAAPPTVTQLGATQSSVGSANVQDLAVSPISYTAIGAETVRCYFQGTAAALRLYAVRYTYDRP